MESKDEFPQHFVAHIFETKDKFTKISKTQWRKSLFKYIRNTEEYNLKMNCILLWIKRKCWNKHKLTVSKKSKRGNTGNNWSEKT